MLAYPQIHHPSYVIMLYPYKINNKTCLKLDKKMFKDIICFFLGGDIIQDLGHKYDCFNHKIVHIFLVQTKNKLIEKMEQH
jgi:hypothetical protein